MNTDLAWAAGFIDGEGCIRIYRNPKRGRQMSLSVTQVNPAPLLKLRSLFGGTIYRSDTTAGRRAQFSWKVHTRQAETVLRSLLPFLVNKADEAEMAVAFQAHKAKGGGLIPDEFYYAEEDAWLEAIAEVKRIEYPNFGQCGPQ